MINREDLRRLLREMVRQMGAERACFEYYFNGLPPKWPGGPQSHIAYKRPETRRHEASWGVRPSDYARRGLGADGWPRQLPDRDPERMLRG